MAKKDIIVEETQPVLEDVVETVEQPIEETIEETQPIEEVIVEEPALEQVEEKEAQPDTTIEYKRSKLDSMIKEFEGTHIEKAAIYLMFEALF